MFEFENGKKVLLPLSWKKRAKGMLKEYISSPAGTYGGFITNDYLTSIEIKLLEEYITKYSSILIRENPFQKILSVEFWNKRDFTQILHLNSGLDTILKKWSQRTFIRLSKKEND